MKKANVRTARLLLATFGLQTAAVPAGTTAEPPRARDAAPVYGMGPTQAFDGPAAVATTALSQLWPPEHAFVDVGLRVVASDPSGVPPTAALEVWSDEAEDAGPPVHTPDAELSAQALRLRSERLGDGDGRVYLLIARVSGASGRTHACATVTVPHSQSEDALALVNAQAAAARAHCATAESAPPAYLKLAEGAFEVTEPGAPVRPLLECVLPLPNGRFAAVFGYDNPNPVPVPVALGQDNAFDPEPADRGQPQAFMPGRTPADEGAFQATFAGSLTWRLKGLSVTASETTRPCEAAPRTPEARDDVAATRPGTPVAIDALANDSDPQGDALRVVRIGAPAQGTAAVGTGGLVTYIPAAGFEGTDTFTYTVSDGLWGTDQAAVTVTVTADNQAPRVDAGPDLFMTLPADVGQLNGTVADD
ncbi:MAG TPA: cadherin-like domain-containing protein, partial [Vicinamibacteria bacterium]|nr:cadherin-like domain-containing protein [Vicinamibacteria bacterium]